MVRTIEHATRIVTKMAKERYCSIDKVLAEYEKYQVNGECKHFWPDENTACKLLIEQRVQS